MVSLLTILAITATGTEPVPGIGDEPLDDVIRDLLDMYWEEPDTRGFLVLADTGVVATLITTAQDGAASGLVAVTRYDIAASTTLYSVAYRTDADGRYDGTTVMVLEPAEPALA